MIEDSKKDIKLTDINDENLKLITKYLENITKDLRTSIGGFNILYKLITIIFLISPKVLLHLNLIYLSPEIQNICALLAIIGIVLLVTNVINIFWRTPEYLISESSLLCLILFNLGDRFWKYCNKNWLIGFITSFLRLPSFVFATILYHAMLAMEKIKSLPSIIRSIPSKIKSLVIGTKGQQNIKNIGKILGRKKEIDEISKGLLRILGNRSRNITRTLLRPFLTLKDKIDSFMNRGTDKGSGTEKGFAGGKSVEIGHGRKPRGLGIRENERKASIGERETNGREQKRTDNLKQKENTIDNNRTDRKSEKELEDNRSKTQDYKDRETKQIENEKKLESTRETTVRESTEEQVISTKPKENSSRDQLLEVFRPKEQPQLTPEQQDSIIDNLPKEVIWAAEEKYGIPIDNDPYIGNPENGILAADILEQQPNTKPIEKPEEEMSLEDMFSIARSSDDTNENASTKNNTIEDGISEIARNELIETTQSKTISPIKTIPNKNTNFSHNLPGFN